MRVLLLQSYDPTPVLDGTEMTPDEALDLLAPHIIYQRILQAVLYPVNIRGSREHRQKMLELQRAVKAVGTIREITLRDEKGVALPRKEKMRMPDPAGCRIMVRNESLWELLKKSVETYFEAGSADLEQAELVQTFLDDVKQEADEPTADDAVARRARMAARRDAPRLPAAGRRP